MVFHERPNYFFLCVGQKDCEEKKDDSLKYLTLVGSISQSFEKLPGNCTTQKYLQTSMALMSHTPAFTTSRPV